MRRISINYFYVVHVVVRDLVVSLAETSDFLRADFMSLPWMRNRLIAIHANIGNYEYTYSEVDSNTKHAFTITTTL